MDMVHGKLNRSRQQWPHSSLSVEDWIKANSIAVFIAGSSPDISILIVTVIGDDMNENRNNYAGE